MVLAAPPETENQSECSPAWQSWHLGEKWQLKIEEIIFRELLELCQELTAWEHWELKSSSLIFWFPTPTPPSWLVVVDGFISLNWRTSGENCYKHSGAHTMTGGGRSGFPVTKCRIPGCLKLPKFQKIFKILSNFRLSSKQP